MERLNEQDLRIAGILGDAFDNDAYYFEDLILIFHAHLQKNLRLPCRVTGIEDFRWEGFYLLGPGDLEEYQKLRRTQPSYEDIYELLSVQAGVYSDWMIFNGEDLAAHVRRESDGKEFYLGLSEIEVIDKKSPNYQLIDDYAVWFDNNR